MAGAACPSRDYFIEPDSGLPLKCDMCDTIPALDEPWCVKVCEADALTYFEREVEKDEKPEEKRGDVEIGLELLINRYGIEQVVESLNLMPRAIESDTKVNLGEEPG